MKKLLRRLILLGAIAGAAYAARSSNTTEGQEFTDIARKLVEARL